MYIIVLINLALMLEYYVEFRLIIDINLIINLRTNLNIEQIYQC